MAASTDPTCRPTPTAGAVIPQPVNDATAPRKNINGNGFNHNNKQQQQKHEKLQQKQ
jgi:hypothetical protein